jgi:hypothetical protein
MRTFEVFCSVDDNPAEKLGDCVAISPIDAIIFMYHKVHDRLLAREDYSNVYVDDYTARTDIIKGSVKYKYLAEELSNG